MRSFESGAIRNLRVTHPLLQSIRLLGEYKGKQDMFRRQFPQSLESLRQVALIQSTESSNRIEGVVAPTPRIKALVANQTTPRTRPEQEIAGYRDVLNTVHGSWAKIPVSVSVVLQFHRDLMRYTPSGGGHWKPGNNLITETLPDGSQRVRFEPVPAHLTTVYMNRLHDAFAREWLAGEIDPQLLIPAYAIDFLCIHPFTDGNGRLSRLLTLLLLYKAGYEVGRFISLERIIEETKEGYYESLLRSSARWHDAKHDLLPWTEYLLGVLTRAYREFEERVGSLADARGAKTDMVRDAVQRLPDGFRMAELERLCPTVSKEMIRHVMDRLKQEGIVWREGAGPAAVWRKRSDQISH